MGVKEINNYLNNLPNTIKNAPTNEKIAYFAVIGGIILLIVGIFIKIVF